MGISDENVSKLRDYIAANGNVIKNFKVLCDIMEIPYINKGKGFKTQREELGCFIKWKKNGHKILVEEIYETPFRIVKNPRATYATSIEYIMVDMLKEEMKKGRQYVRYTIRELSGALGFWNQDFYNYQYKKKDLFNENIYELEELLETCEIEESFNHMEDEFMLEWLYKKCLFQARNIIKRTLKNLKKKQIIDYEEVYQVQCSGFGPDVVYYVEPTNEKEWNVIQKCNLAADRKYTALLNDKLVSEGKTPNAAELEHGQLLYKLYVNGMIEQYYDTLRNFYSIMYKKEKILEKGMKFLRIIPAYKIFYKSTTEYKDIDVWEEAYKLNNIFMKSIYNSFKRQRKEIVSIAYSDDPDHSVIIYTFIDGDKINIDISGKDFDRTTFYSNIDLYRIRYWICLILKLTYDYDEIFDLDMDLVNNVY